MRIRFKEDGEKPSLLFEQGSLRIVRVEIMARIGVYKPEGNDSLTNYCDFAVAIVSEFKTPFYLILNAPGLFFVKEGVKAHEIERYFRVLP